MLSELKCSQIEKGTPTLPTTEVQKMLIELPGWTLNNSAISREFKFKDFTSAMEFVNKVAEIANAEDHHPDINISYNKVKMELSTHKIGGLSMNDFIMAAKINMI